MFKGEDREHFKKKATLPQEPVIFVTNHRFKDDVLATLIAAEKRAFIIFGSLPQFYGNFDGYLSAKNGAIMVDRKVATSRSTSIEKGQYALKKGMNLMVCPEGVWNKTPNELMINFWSGFYRMAKKEDGTFYPIVPIIHYINNTHKPGKDNPIHTIVDDPIILDGMDEKEGIEYVRSRMMSWYWRLMEKFGKSSHYELLDGYSDSQEAWEDELKKRVGTTSKYDLPIEISADRRKKNMPLEVFEPIAKVEPNRENIEQVLKAKQMVDDLKKNDFQHRF